MSFLYLTNHEDLQQKESSRMQIVLCTVLAPGKPIEMMGIKLGTTHHKMRRT